jgi:two-component system chemotaxis response regulator CheY
LSKNVLDIGNCTPDHAAIRALIEGSFDARVSQAHDGDEALAVLRTGDYQLVLVNRKLDRDGSDGLEVIRRIKSLSGLSHTPIMMITNYAEYQQQAVEAGAEPGFGKSDLRRPETIELLAAFLGSE